MTYVLDEVHTTQTVMTNKAHAVPKNVIFWARKGVLGTKIKILEGNCNIFGMCGYSCVRICEMVAAEAEEHLSEEPNRKIGHEKIQLYSIPLRLL